MSLFALRHTEEGQQILGKLLVHKYVQRGARWLNRHAPGGWYRNCLNGGTSRVRSAGGEGILANAFEYCEQFADNSGCVNEGKIARGFGFGKYSRRYYRHGFGTPFRNYPLFKKYPHVKIGDEMLDAAWAELLKDPPGGWRMPYRHQTAFDRRFATLNFSVGTRFSLRLWLKNLFRRRKQAVTS